MLDVVQQRGGGIAPGCVHGLIAPGFVLIYKATEVVEFAPGDQMNLSGCLEYKLADQTGLNHWLGFELAASAMAAFGTVVAPVIVRHTLGPPSSASSLTNPAVAICAGRDSSSISSCRRCASGTRSDGRRPM